MINRKLFLEEVLKTRGNKGDNYCRYAGVNYNFNWCAIFVSYILREVAGIKDFPKSTSCTQIKNSLFSIPKLNKSFKTAEVGDVILFELNNPSDGPDHIGIVIGNNNGIISVIEGNTGSINFNNSYVSVYTYSVNNRALDYIIDMSSYFTDDNTTNTTNTTKTTKTTKSTEAELREVFRKIKDLLLSVEL